MSTPRRIVVLGAGPIGLDAALAAVRSGNDVTVLEQDTTVGGHVRRWGHVRMFTSWDWNVSDRARAALGADAPAGPGLPTGEELATCLLDRVAALPELAGRVRTGARVLAVGREGLLKHEEIGSAARAARPFRVLVQDVASGEQSVLLAEVVIDATGTYGTPNRLGDGGIDALGEARFEDRIERAIPDVGADPSRWAGRTVLLSGAGHSAQTAARDLAALARESEGTRIVWAVRAPRPGFGAVADDPLPARAALVANAIDLASGANPRVDVVCGVVTEALVAEGDRVAVTLRNGAPSRVVVDEIVALTGSVGDASIHRQLQVHECYASLGPMRLAATLGAPGADCLALADGDSGPEVLLNPEPNFFILGAKSYGRNSQFLLRTGYRQVDDVVGTLMRR
jgi:hypothetical protein